MIVGFDSDHVMTVTATGESRNDAKEKAAKRMLERLRDKGLSLSSFTRSTTARGRLGFITPRVQPGTDIVKIYLNEHGIWSGMPAELSNPRLWQSLTRLCNRGKDSRSRVATSGSSNSEADVNSSVVSSINISTKTEESKLDLSIAQFAVDPDEVCVISPPLVPELPMMEDVPTIGAEVVLGDEPDLTQTHDNDDRILQDSRIEANNLESPPGSNSTEES